MSDKEMWAQALTLVLTGGAGVLVFAAMEFIKKLTDPVHPLTGHAKFYLSMFLAFLLPGAVYAGAVGFGAVEFSLFGVAGVFGAGYVVSKTIHFEGPAAADRKEAADNAALVAALAIEGDLADTRRSNSLT